MIWMTMVSLTVICVLPNHQLYIALFPISQLTERPMFSNTSALRKKNEQNNKKPSKTIIKIYNSFENVMRVRSFKEDVSWCLMNILEKGLDNLSSSKMSWGELFIDGRKTTEPSIVNTVTTKLYWWYGCNYYSYVIVNTMGSQTPPSWLLAHPFVQAQMWVLKFYPLLGRTFIM